MNSFIIKIIATFFMSIDHIGLVLLNNNTIFRFFGRIAFPLYGFLLVEGFIHTKNNPKRLIKYFISLISLGMISELIHDFTFFNTIYYPLKQNILFTLSLSLLCMTIYEKNSKNIIDKLISLMVVILIAGINELLFFDYGFFGVLLIFSFYLISKVNIKKIYKNILYILAILTYFIFRYIINGYLISTFGVFLSLIPILLYNENKGYNSKIIKYSFYLYYPIHLLLILLMK